MNQTDKKLSEWADHILGIKESPRLKKLGVTNQGVGFHDK